MWEVVEKNDYLELQRALPSKETSLIFSTLRPAVVYGMRLFGLVRECRTLACFALCRIMT